MSPLPATKRRRLDKSSDTLSKPFKSPFKTPLKQKALNEASTTATPSTLCPSPEKASSTPTTKPPPPATPSSSTVSPPAKLPSPPPQAPQPQPTNPSTSNPPPAPTTTTTSAIDSSPPSLQTLQKQHTSLLTSLSAARTHLDISTQALKIETEDPDTELRSLIHKWRLASREAAEEVFRSARDRVNKMGGVKGLREKERSAREREREWAEENFSEVVEGGRRGEGDGEGKDGEGDEDKVDRYERQDVDGAGFRAGEGEGGYDDLASERKDGEDRKGDQEEEDEEKGYTMDMMLKSLGIELGVIGFDKEAGRWVD